MSSHSTTSVDVYLTFDGNCREAMSFYRDVLQGELEIMPFEGAPMEVPDSHKDKVMHATLKLGNAVLMASDSMPGQPVERGNGYSVSLSLQEQDLAEQFFNGLAEGGTVVMPYQKTFWGANFGVLTDKFGVSWMVNCDLEGQ
ncbi:MAG: VOC family protein [Bacteroidetes bacterium]|nr:MAG: VOC family protein [Bacteroidota bacterium]